MNRRPRLHGPATAGSSGSGSPSTRSSRALPVSGDSNPDHLFFKAARLLNKGGAITVSRNVYNTGQRAGDAVVQLYVDDPDSAQRVGRLPARPLPRRTEQDPANCHLRTTPGLLGQAHPSAGSRSYAHRPAGRRLLDRSSFASHGPGPVTVPNELLKAGAGRRQRAQSLPSPRRSPAMAPPAPIPTRSLESSGSKAPQDRS